MHQLSLVCCHKRCLLSIPTKKSPWVLGLGNAQGIQRGPFVQSMCQETLHRGKLVHRDGIGEVWKLHHTSIGDNLTAIRSPLLTIQTILFRDSSREAGLRPQILASTTGQIINHYQNFSYSNRIQKI